MEKNLWENLKAIFWRYRLRYAKAALLVITGNLLLILTPMVFREAVMAMAPQTGQPSGFLDKVLRGMLGTHVTSLEWWVILLVSIAATAAVFKYFMRIAFINISREVEFEVRLKLFTRMQEQSMAFYDRHGIGELLSRLTNDISTYRDVLSVGIIFPSHFTTLIIPGLVALFMISPPLAITSVIPLVSIPLLNFAMRKSVYSLAMQAQKGLADLSNLTQEQFSGIRIVKGYAAEPLFENLFRRVSHHLIKINIKLNFLQGTLSPFFGFLTRTITVVLVIVAAYIVFEAWGTLSVADFLSFMWIQSYVFFPILMLAWVLPLYQRGEAAYERLVEIFNEPVEVVDNAKENSEIKPGDDIEFRDLTFCYPNSTREVLKNLSLKIKGGSFVGLTGPVGAGKTTLLRLLNREYEMPMGKLFIGGKEIHEYPLNNLWKEMVTVEQTPFLFSRTIAENVSLGNEEALLDEIETVSSYADLHETVLSFPEKYNTVIGERGVTLSGGQKQRIAIARAFLVNRSILLLDDVFSAVDSKTEMRIFLSIQSKLRNKTIVLITHRASVLEAMDRVVYMHEGRILEDGAPEELKPKNGYYAALIELQRGHSDGS